MELSTGKTYAEFKKALDNELHQAAAGFVRIGYLLKVARDTDILYESGYKSLPEFAQVEYGLTKDIVSRYIAINDRYSEGGYSEHLKEQYQGYGVAKLAEMLILSDEVINSIPPQLTRDKIQAIKKEIREEEKITDLEVMLEEPDAAPEGVDNNLKKWMLVYFKEHSEEYIKGKRIYLAEEQSEAALDLLAPSGIEVKMARIPGLGKLMLSIKGLDNPLELLNVRNNEKEEYSWADCVKALKSLCPYTTDPKQAWEELYGEKFPEPEKVAPVQLEQPAEPPQKEEPKKVIPIPATQKPVEPEKESKAELEKKPEALVKTEHEAENNKVAPVQQNIEPTEVIEDPCKEHKEKVEETIIRIQALLEDEDYHAAHRASRVLEETLKTILDIKMQEQLDGQMGIEDYEEDQLETM